ncbi:MAG: hypothetical protein RSC93_02245 [Erysipelotrichaceae bacterium]
MTNYSDIVRTQYGVFYVRLDGQLAIDAPAPLELGINEMYIKLFEPKNVEESILDIFFENAEDGHKYLVEIEKLVKTGKYTKI